MVSYKTRQDDFFIKLFLLLLFEVIFANSEYDFFFIFKSSFLNPHSHHKYVGVLVSAVNIALK